MTLLSVLDRGGWAARLEQPKKVESAILAALADTLHPEDAVAISRATQAGDVTIVKSVVERYGISLTRFGGLVIARPYRHSDG